MADGGEKAEISEESARLPLGVTCDEEGASTVRLCVVIPGVRKKFGKNAIDKGHLTVNYGERSLDLKANVIIKENGNTKFELYRYSIKRLPDEILKDKCRHKVRKDKIVLYLEKAKPRSWAAELDQTGPETYRPEDEPSDQ